jgi:hypothetical protein
MFLWNLFRWGRHRSDSDTITISRREFRRLLTLEARLTQLETHVKKESVWAYLRRLHQRTCKLETSNNRLSQIVERLNRTNKPLPLFETTDAGNPGKPSASNLEE